MKTAGLVLAMISYAALMCGRGYAASSTASQHGSSAHSTDTTSDHPRSEQAAQVDGRKHETGEKSSAKRQLNRPALAKNHAPRRASLSKTSRPEQLPNHQEHSASANVMNLHEPGSRPSASAAKGGLVQNEAGSHALPVRSPSVTRTAAPPLDDARHRSPNAAIVGGSANLTTRNTGAINGTRMSRKP